MTHLIQEIQPLALIASVASLFVILAMTIDLIAGLNKARIRGEMRSSWALKRTVTKFISYIGCTLIAFGIDVIAQLSRIHILLNLETLSHIPAATCTISVFLLTVEIVSIRESADSKTLKRQNDVADTIAKLLRNVNKVPQ